MSPNRQTITILGLTLVLTGLSWGLLHTGLWRAELAETNFQANLIRLQDFVTGRAPKAVVTGSSISGRLLPSYFENTGLSPMANLGLDGSSALFGLGLVAERPPQVVLIEVNTILKPPDQNDELLASTVTSFGFRLARNVPPLQARARPSSVLYNWIKTRQNGRVLSEAVPAAAPATRPATNASSKEPGETETPNSEPVKRELRERIQQLEAKGCTVILVRMPWGNRANNNPAFEFGDRLSRDLKLRQIDLQEECLRRGWVLSYTDGLHLAPGSAREASRALAESVLAARSGATASIETGSGTNRQ